MARAADDLIGVGPRGPDPGWGGRRGLRRGRPRVQSGILERLAKLGRAEPKRDGTAAAVVASADHRVEAARDAEPLGELAEAGTLYLTFSGGEVFLRPDLFELIEAAKR